MKKTPIIVIFLAIFTLISCVPSGQEESEESTDPVYSGPYLGQNLPGDTPELFAPGIVTTGMFTRDIAMTPEGDEIYFGVAVGNYAYTTILYSRQVKGEWTHPEVAPHMDDSRYMNLEPCISPDGKHFFFLSNRPDSASGNPGRQDIWIMDRQADGWGEPYNPGPPINSEGSEFFPSVTHDGTIYFTRAEAGTPIHNIYRSRLIDGKYSEPEILPEQVNCGANRYNAFVAQDESYMIVPAVGMPDGYGRTDYYIVFRNDEDQWSEPVNMGDLINTAGDGEYSAYVTIDGKYLFFMSSRLMPESERPQILTYKTLQTLYNQPQNGNADIYWLKADFIENLRPEGF